MLFRNKLKSKFNQQTGKLVINKDKNKNPVNPSYISTLSSSILAKSSKEINKISKFFKKKSPPELKKLYAQAFSKQNALEIARETLRIKDAFPNL